MRRIQLVLAALAVAVASFAAISGPAMADDLNCRDAKGDLIRCDWDLYTPYNNNNNDYYNYYNPYYYDMNDYYSPYYNYWNDYSSCPFWGDTSGIVNQGDCF